MPKRASGEYLGVKAGWWQDTPSNPIDAQALRNVFDGMREEAASQGCESFPTREDCAAHRLLFEELCSRYTSVTGTRPDWDILRRHVCAIHKEGGTPE